MAAAALVTQYAIVSLAVAASAAFVVQKQWPAGVRRMRIACAVRMLRETRPARMRRAGRWIAPAALAGGASCEGSCDGCSSH